MRPTQKQNRPRGRGGRKPGGGGGGGNNINRVYESNGPEGKVRGTPQQIVEKYQSLARDAQTSGDRVVAENFLQHAEHYQRILLEAMGTRPEQRSHPSEQDQPDIDGSDDDGDDETEAATTSEARQPQDGNGQHREPRERREPREPREPRSQQPRHEVSGLTTFDTGEPGSGSLLVDAEEITASQPRRRRRSPARAEAANEAPAAEPPAETPSE